MESKNVDDMKVEIKDTLTCFICTAKVLDPLMCPKCKKLVCTNCIKKWFEQDHDKCPFCQTQSSFENMISLPFMNDLSEYFIKEIDNKKNEKNKINMKDLNKIIDDDEEIISISNSQNSLNNFSDINNINDDKKNLSKTQIISNKIEFDGESNINNENNFIQYSNIKRGELCPNHKGEIIEYYCLNCNTKHCSKCLMIINKESKIHEGHKIITIEQKNKYNLDEIKEDINNLSNVANEISKYKDTIDMDSKIIEKREEFVKKVIDEFKEYYIKKSGNKRDRLDIKAHLIQNQLDRINNIRNNYTESLNNFVERDDENGFKEYQQKIKDFKDTNDYQYPNNFNLTFNPNLKFYETDYIDIDINEYDENIGEIYFNVEGIEKQLHFKLNGEAIDEVLVNLQIESDKLGDEKDRYFGLLLFQKNNKATYLFLDEKMVHNEILILGRTIVKSGLKSIVDDQNKCHFKLILAIFSV